MLAWCFFFFFPFSSSYVQTWGVFEPLYMLRLCVACMKTERLGDANRRYHRPASKWMFKTNKKKQLGRKEGGWERETGGVGGKRIGALWRMDALVQLLSDFVNSYCSNSVTCFHLWFVPLLLLCPVVSLSSSLFPLQTLYSSLCLSLPLYLS